MVTGKLRPLLTLPGFATAFYAVHAVTAWIRIRVLDTYDRKFTPADSLEFNLWSALVLTAAVTLVFAVALLAWRRRLPPVRPLRLVLWGVGAGILAAGTGLALTWAVDEPFGLGTTLVVVVGCPIASAVIVRRGLGRLATR